VTTQTYLVKNSAITFHVKLLYIFTLSFIFLILFFLKGRIPESLSSLNSLRYFILNDTNIEG
jgi:hypothetical protein